MKNDKPVKKLNCIFLLILAWIINPCCAETESKVMWRIIIYASVNWANTGSSNDLPLFDTKLLPQAMQAYCQLEA